MDFLIEFINVLVFRGCEFRDVVHQLQHFIEGFLFFLMIILLTGGKRVYIFEKVDETGLIDLDRLQHTNKLLLGFGSFELCNLLKCDLKHINNLKCLRLIQQEQSAINISMSNIKTLIKAYEVALKAKSIREIKKQAINLGIIAYKVNKETLIQSIIHNLSQNPQYIKSKLGNNNSQQQTIQHTYQYQQNKDQRIKHYSNHNNQLLQYLHHKKSPKQQTATQQIEVGSCDDRSYENFNNYKNYLISNFGLNPELTINENLHYDYNLSKMQLAQMIKNKNKRQIKKNITENMPKGFIHKYSDSQSDIIRYYQIIKEIKYHSHSYQPNLRTSSLNLNYLKYYQAFLPSSINQLSIPKLQSNTTLSQIFKVLWMISLQQSHKQNRIIVDTSIERLSESKIAQFQDIFLVVNCLYILECQFKIEHGLQHIVQQLLMMMQNLNTKQVLDVLNQHNISNFIIRFCTLFIDNEEVSIKAILNIIQIFINIKFKNQQMASAINRFLVSRFKINSISQQTIHQLISFHGFSPEELIQALQLAIQYSYTSHIQSTIINNLCIEDIPSLTTQQKTFITQLLQSQLPTLHSLSLQIYEQLTKN